ncbi:MAG: beta-galactosidase, partial [Terriglobia bacterium]
MPNWTRRDFLKSGIAASASAKTILPGTSNALFAQGQEASTSASQPASANTARERLLLDFGWRFHLGHADDPSLDFGYGRDREYAKTGSCFMWQSEGRPRKPGQPGPSSPRFNDSDWRALDLPHDWAVELPFQEDPWLTEHGSKPLGRTYPATSIGWYRRVFDISESDSGKRLS